MRLGDTTSTAGGNLFRRKGRTVLTVIGVTIGVAALVLMVSLGIGVKMEMLSLFQSDDALSIIFVAKVKSTENSKKRGPFSVMDRGNILPLTDADVSMLAAIPGVSLAYPDLDLMLEAKCEAAPDAESRLFILGTPPEEVKRLRPYLVAGDFWKGDDETTLVLPTSWVGDMPAAGWTSLIGKPITFESRRAGIDSVEWTIAGILDSRKMGLRGDAAPAPMPATRSLRKHMQGGIIRSLYDEKEDRYYNAFVRVDDPTRVREVRNRIKNSGYEAVTAMDLIEAVGTMFLVVQGFMACIGGVGLLVSLFGIANTMAMSVLERTREIGIMKALGATRRDVLKLFLMEAAAIGLLGGIAGLVLGWAGGLLFNGISHAAFSVPDGVRLFHVSLWLVGGSIAFSIVVAMGAGFIPARRAARLEPVKALRYE